MASASPERLADSMVPRTSSATLTGTHSPLRPVRLVRTDGAIDGVLIAGNPAAGRGTGTTSLHYPRLPDRARSIRSNRCCALRLSHVRLVPRGCPANHYRSRRREKVQSVRATDTSQEPTATEL